MSRCETPPLFSANRERLFSEGQARVFFERIKALADWRRLTSSEHFSVNGTLIDAWPSHKCPRPSAPGAQPWSRFQGQATDQ